MEDGIIDMEDLERVGELGSVPVVVSGENGGLGF